MESLSVPRVSVLIPAYNAGPTVESAVDSILRQTYGDFELVVVDDGSTDATPAILDAYAPSTGSGCSGRQDSRVRVIHTPNAGIIEALNTGLEECRGEFIARMDADDVSHPRRLEMQVELMDARPDISVCSCLVRMFPRKALMGGLVRYEQWLNSLVTPEEIARDIFVESPVAHPSVMVRREELLSLGACDPSTSSGCCPPTSRCCVYQEHGWAEDYDLWLRYHVAGKRFAKVEKMLLWWRQSEGRLTFTDSRYSVENFLRAKAHYLECGMRSAECGMGRSECGMRSAECGMGRGSGDHPRPVVLWGAGKTGRRLLKHLLREGVDVEAIIDIDPAKIGHRMRERPIVGVEYLRQPGFETRSEEISQPVHGRSHETAGVGGRPYVISAVSSHGARELIREQLRGLGFVEMRDFVCAA